MEFLNKYITVPYKSHGRGFDGIDCWGLVYLIYLHDLGITLPTYVEDYESIEDSEAVGTLVDKESEKWTKVDKPEKFDVIIIRMKGFPMHCAVYVGEGKFIHCLKGVNVSMEKLRSVSWKNRIEGFYRYEK